MGLANDDLDAIKSDPSVLQVYGKYTPTEKGFPQIYLQNRATFLGELRLR